MTKNSKHEQTYDERLDNLSEENCLLIKNKFKKLINYDFAAFLNTCVHCLLTNWDLLTKCLIGILIYLRKLPQLLAEVKCLIRIWSRIGWTLYLGDVLYAAAVL